MSSSSSSSLINPDLLKKEEELRKLNDLLNQQTHNISISSPSLPPSFTTTDKYPINNHNTSSPRSSSHAYQLPPTSPPSIITESPERIHQAMIAGERAMATLRPEAQTHPSLSPNRNTKILDTRVPTVHRSPNNLNKGSGSNTTLSPPTVSNIPSSSSLSSNTKKSTATTQSRIPTKKRSTLLPNHNIKAANDILNNDNTNDPDSEQSKPGITLSTLELDPDLPLEMQVKILKSHVHVARTEAQDAAMTASRLAMELAEARKETNNITEERQRLKRTATIAETALEKAKKAAALAETREQELRQQIITLQKEATTSSKVAKQAESSSSAMDARLVRAQEEIERLKSQLVTERNQFIENQQQSKREIELLQTALKKLERQKTELLVTFKKQIKLIDILKRQRIHMEAARMLAFTEEEFAKILEVGF